MLGYFLLTKCLSYKFCWSFDRTACFPQEIISPLEAQATNTNYTQKESFVPTGKTLISDLGISNSSG